MAWNFKALFLRSGKMKRTSTLTVVESPMDRVRIAAQSPQVDQRAKVHSTAWWGFLAFVPYLAVMMMWVYDATYGDIWDRSQTSLVARADGANLLIDARFVKHCACSADRLSFSLVNENTRAIYPLVDVKGPIGARAKVTTLVTHRPIIPYDVPAGVYRLRLYAKFSGIIMDRQDELYSGQFDIGALQRPTQRELTQ
jgi:hypothetical protein